MQDKIRQKKGEEGSKRQRRQVGVFKGKMMTVVKVEMLELFNYLTNYHLSNDNPASQP